MHIKPFNNDEIVRPNIEWRKQHQNTEDTIEIFESAVHVDKGNESVFRFFFFSYFRVPDDGSIH